MEIIRPLPLYDNAAMESWMATYKRECVALAGQTGGYATRPEAKADFFDYVEIYDNRVRRKPTCATCSPAFQK